MKTTKKFYDAVNKLGAVTGNHESDLYTKITPEVTQLAKEYGLHGNEFIDQRTKERSYEFAFQYQPYWDKVDKLNRDRDRDKFLKDHIVIAHVG